MTNDTPSPPHRSAACRSVGIIDDHQMFAAGLATWLGLHFDRLCVTVLATRWTELLTAPGFPTDVVLLDLDLADRVPPRVKITTLVSAGVTVIVVSASAIPATVRGCLAAGALGYVSKADVADEIVAAIDEALQGRLYLSPVLAAVLQDGPAPTPALSDQETRVLALYAGGLPLKTVARQLNVSYETAKTYLDRIRDKYAQAGRPAATKLDLRDRALEDGLATPSVAPGR